MKKTTEQIDKLYPLTPGQQTILYGEAFSLQKQAMNISTSIHFDCEIDPALMKKAIELECERCDAAKIRLHKDGKTTKMYFSKLPPEPIEVLDASGMSEDELKLYLNKISSKPFPNKRRDVQLYKIMLIKKQNGFYAIYVKLHHVTMDTYSVLALGTQIIELYDALYRGAALPPNKNNVLALYEKVMEQSEAKTRRAEANLAYWRDVAYEPEPLCAPVCGKNSKKSDTKPLRAGKRYANTNRVLSRAGKILDLRVPAELVKRVEVYAREHKVPEQILFLLAIRSHLSRENNYQNDVSVTLSVAKRATLIEKNALITRADAIFYRMNMPNDLSFAQACDFLATKQIEYLRHSDFGAQDNATMIVKKFNIPYSRDYFEPMVTYQRLGIIAPEYIKYHLCHHETGISLPTMTILIVAMDNSGDLVCDYEYATQFIDERAVRALHGHMLHFLDTALDNPEMSLEDIMRSEPLRLS